MVPPLLITSESPTSILKLFVLLAVPEMEQVPVLPAFHVPGKDLQRVPFRDGIETGLAALEDGVSVTRSVSEKIPIRLLDLFILNIFNTSFVEITSNVF
jgi:hypothetical protein